MIGEIPIVSFDTSTHNRVTDGGDVAEAVLAGLKSGLSFRFVGLSDEELLATTNPTRRGNLLTTCARLQDGLSECIYPHNELLTRMIVAHSQNPATFNWKTVDVKAREYERAIRSREFIPTERMSDDERAELQRLSDEQKTHLRERQDEYETMFVNIRPELEPIFARHGEERPLTLREVVTRLQESGSSLIWDMGKLIYDRPAGTDASEATIRAFADTCPPFRALLYAMVMSWYNLAMRGETGERFEAGRNDLFMSMHLPYCDKFVSAEKHREQEKCLREIVALAGLETEILSYDDFCASFLVTV